VNEPKPAESKVESKDAYPAADAKPKPKVPDVLPAHEIARAARRSKEEVQVEVTTSWAGISSTIDDIAQVPSPEQPPRRRSQSDPKPKKESALSPTVDRLRIPSTAEMGIPARKLSAKPVTRNSVRRPSMENALEALRSSEITENVTPSWGGVNSYSEHANDELKGSPSPKSAQRLHVSPKALVKPLNQISIPSSAEMGHFPTAARKSTAKKKDATPRTYMPQQAPQWGGVSSIVNIE